MGKERVESVLPEGKAELEVDAEPDQKEEPVLPENKGELKLGADQKKT